MASFEGQHTDGENSKPAPSCTYVDSGLKTGTLGKLQEIAARSHDGQNQLTGAGATAVLASIK